MTLQVSNREQKIVVSLPAPLVKKVVDMANKEDAEAQLSEYIAKVLREAVAEHEELNQSETPDTETEEIRARLKKLGYL